MDEPGVGQPAWRLPAGKHSPGGGARGGIRTHDIQNHNLALLPAELHAPQLSAFYQSPAALFQPETYGKPARCQSSSTRAFTSGDITIRSGQRR